MDKEVLSIFERFPGVKFSYNEENGTFLATMSRKELGCVLGKRLGQDEGAIPFGVVEYGPVINIIRF